ENARVRPGVSSVAREIHERMRQLSAGFLGSKAMKAPSPTGKVGFGFGRAFLGWEDSAVRWSMASTALGRGGGPPSPRKAIANRASVARGRRMTAAKARWSQ